MHFCISNNRQLGSYRIPIEAKSVFRFEALKEAKDRRLI